MTDPAFTTWVASLPSLPLAEVIVPATVDVETLAVLTQRNLIPVLVEIRAPLYVMEAQYAFPAFTSRTVGCVLPWTYGNMPEVSALKAACVVHDVAVHSPEPTGNAAAFWRLYDALTGAILARKVTPPDKLEDCDPPWTHMPLLAPDRETRDRLVAALAAYGVTAMAGHVTQAEGFAALDATVILIGAHDGPFTMGERGFVVPLVDGVGAALVEALR